MTDRLSEIRRRIATAAAASGRDPDDVTLIGAAKRQPLEIVQRTVAAGLDHIGENRVQECRDRKPLLAAGVTWHLIGPLQSNKVNLAVDLFDVIQTVDRVKIAERLDRRAEALDRRLQVMLEINLADEESKHGFSVEKLPDLRQRLAAWPRLEIQGLMAIPPLGETPEDSRPWFRRLRQLRDEFFDTPALASSPGFLSMGMSDDFEVAIEEGATHVRVGTALFGERP